MAWQCEIMGVTASTEHIYIYILIVIIGLCRCWYIRILQKLLARALPTATDMMTMMMVRERVGGALPCVSSLDDPDARES